MKTKQIKNYKVKLNQPIGKGSSAEVFLGEDLNNQCKIAVKISPRVEKAEYEASVMENYGAHPYLIELYDFVIVEGKAYIMMEYFPERGIGHWNYHSTIDIEKKNKEEAVQLTLNILKGLNHLHQSGFAHHDLLPKNILIKDNNPEKIRIIDFGIAKPLNSKKRHKYKVNDLSAAATMCIYLINGSVSKMPLKDLKTIDNDLREVLVKAFKPKLEERYQSAEDLIAVLEPLLNR